jgi:dTDP-4-dehydrorhamnose 3,5-epimerase
MDIQPTKFDGVVILKPKVHTDRRGFFLESYAARTLQALGIDIVFVQDNHSHSVKNTLRGLHYQVSPGQAKLVRVVSGTVFDVAVDLRWGSPTFGQWVGHVLSADNFLQLYIPVGFAHGFCVLSDTADVLYKCSSYYDPRTERGVAWNDPTITIDWPLSDPLLSDRDQNHPLLNEIDRDFVYHDATFS